MTMADVTVAKNCGFCFGVRRAVEMVYALKEKTDKRIVILGELIHNAIFIERLENDGIVCIGESDLDSLETHKDDTVLVIRTHGIRKELAEKLASLGIETVDATCPFVKRIHTIVDENSSDADLTFIVGDPTHPEVIGIGSFAHSPTVVFRDDESCRDFCENDEGKTSKRVVMVSQTTGNYDKYVNCQEIAKNYYTNPKIFDTICNVTENRQKEAASLAAKSDVMFVIGCTKSSNTRKLYEIAAKACKNVFLVEDAGQIDFEALQRIASALGRRMNVGLTAGASTPDDIIEEVKVRVATLPLWRKTAMDTSMIRDDMSFEEMLDATSPKPLRTGERVKGVVSTVTPTEAHVEIVGSKYTGLVPLSELTDDPTAKVEDIVKVGDEIDIVVVKPNDAEGTIMLSKKRIDADKNWEALEAAGENGGAMSGKVIEVTKGGLVVITAAGRVFVPISQTTLPRREEPYTEADLQQFMGQMVEFKVISTDPHKKRAVGSIRALNTERRKAAEAKFWETAEVGQKFTGKVKSITSYGAFVDLGAVDGMVHVTELSWKRIKNPTEVVNIGDEIDVYIKALDPEKKRISLGHRVDADNPWTILENKYQIGDVLEVKIVSLTPFGAFAEVIPGIDGLIHISQIADHKIVKPSDELNIGDVVNVKLTAVDFENKRVSLSIRALLEPEEAEEAEAPAEEEAVEYSTDAPADAE